MEYCLLNFKPLNLLALARNQKIISCGVEFFRNFLRFSNFSLYVGGFAYILRIRPLPSPLPVTGEGARKKIVFSDY